MKRPATTAKVQLVSKPTQRKLKRHNQRKKSRQERNRSHIARQAAVAQFPRIVYESGDAPTALVNTVRRTMAFIASNHAKLFSEHFNKLLLPFKMFGYSTVLKALQQATQRHGNHDRFEEIYFQLGIGEALFNHLPPTIRNSYLPQHDIVVQPGAPRPNEVRIRFRALRQIKTPGGRAYFSPQEPALFVNDTNRIVSFSNHAIGRIRERVVYNPESYGGHGDVFAFLHDCVYFESCTLTDGSPAFAIYNRLFADSLRAEIYDQMIDPTSDKERLNYRVGYCPVFTHGSYVVAKTLLVPGMRNTPEFADHMRRRKLATVERYAYEARVSSLTFRRLIETRDTSLLTEFHSAGIAQVKQIDEEVFRYV